MYTGTLFTRKTDDGYIEILESGVYITVHGIGVIISYNDGNTYDMPHGMAYVHNGAFHSPMSKSTVTVRSNEIVNDYDESTAMVYLTKGDVIAPFIYAPTRIYNPIKVEYSNVRIVKLASSSQITHNHGAYAVTPALAKTAIETFAPTIVNNTINSSESTLHQTIQNMIDASTPEVTPESFTGILPITKGGTGNATGKATTATKLATARTITIAGDATGSASFDGSANATITVDVVNATNATKWSGATKYVSTAAASGGVNGDIWFQYI